MTCAIVAGGRERLASAHSVFAVSIPDDIELTRNWLYSFSKRFRRRTGSFAASLAVADDDKGLLFSSFDHYETRWTVYQLELFHWAVGGNATYKVHGAMVVSSRCISKNEKRLIVVADYVVLVVVAGHSHEVCCFE